MAALKAEITLVKSLENELVDAKELIAAGEQDEKIISQLAGKIAKEEFRIFLSGKYDQSNAIVEIFSGAGGQDAQDWATMLLRMYERYAAKKGFKVEILHQSFGDGGGPEGRIGTKSVTLEVKGNYAYGFLKKEAGVHRLVRLSPFNAQKLRQTSFAMVSVLPEIDQDQAEVEIKPEDLKLETFKSSGPGGQYVNKTESAVRIIHIPTGLTVACQTERSQMKNREHALKILQAKLYQLQSDEHPKELKDIKTAQVEPGRASSAGGANSASWGNQIRSYVLHPYQMVKDLRTQYETSKTEDVLNGDLDEFIEAEMKYD